MDFMQWMQQIQQQMQRNAAPGYAQGGQSFGGGDLTMNPQTGQMTHADGSPVTMRPDSGFYDPATGQGGPRNPDGSPMTGPQMTGGAGNLGGPFNGGGGMQGMGGFMQLMPFLMSMFGGGGMQRMQGNYGGGGYGYQQAGGMQQQQPQQQKPEFKPFSPGQGPVNSAGGAPLGGGFNAPPQNPTQGYSHSSGGFAPKFEQF